MRSGGHSIPGFSTCDDGIVIDLSRMNGVTVDAGARTAAANGGALLGELDREAQAVGLVCPVGVISHTGVAGLTLGGGMGRLQRKHGLTIDNLLAVDLVTADGRIVRASEDENPDLFWGLRGAGANFGIATGFRFRLHPLEWQITHGAVVHPVERATELAARFRELVETGPDELWASYGLGFAGERPVAMVTVMHSGRVEEAARDLAELRAFGQPLADSIEAKPHLVPQTMNDEAQAWGQRFSMKSAFVPALPDELVVALRREPRARARGNGLRLLRVGVRPGDRACAGRGDGLHRPGRRVLARGRGALARPGARRRVPPLGARGDGRRAAVRVGGPVRQRRRRDRRGPRAHDLRRRRSTTGSSR